MAMRMRGNTPCEDVGIIFSRCVTSAAELLKCGLRSMSCSSQLLLLALKLPRHVHFAPASL